MSATAYPYGSCECREERCNCHGGPAAYTAVREGKEVRLCTRCVLRKDVPTRRLLVTPDTSPEPFFEHDLLGFFRITMDMAAEMEAAARGGLQ